MKTFKLSNTEKAFARENLYRFTNAEMLEHFNANRGEPLKLTTLRTLLYKMGLKRCNILRWTDEETQYLMENYKTKGNIELAKDLSKLKLSKHRFNKKNIEKKMTLMGLKRDAECLEQIRLNHLKNGSYARGNKNMWQTRGVTKVGELKFTKINGKYFEVIKTPSGFKHYPRWKYELHYGKLPAGYKVYHIDGNRLNNSAENLIAKEARGLTAAEKKLYKKHDQLNMERIEAAKYKHVEVKPHYTIMDCVKENKIRVVIDKKTTVFVKPGTNVEAVRLKYLNAG